MTHDEVRELLGAYALGALAPHEMQDVAAHCATCGECAEEAQMLQGVGDQLALTAPELTPPAALRTRLMNLVELDRRQWLQSQGGVDTIVAPVGESAPWWRHLPRLAYGALGAAAVAIVLVVVLLTHRQDVTVHTYTAHVAARVVKGVAMDNVVATIDVRSDHTTAVRFTNLPLLPPSLAYELWLLPVHGSPVPIDGFESGANHVFSQSYSRDASGFSAAAVSIERAPGRWPAPSPSGVAFEVPLGA